MKEEWPQIFINPQGGTFKCNNQKEYESYLHLFSCMRSEKFRRGEAVNNWIKDEIEAGRRKT